eukprot:gene6440-3068_t
MRWTPGLFELDGVQNRDTTNSRPVHCAPPESSNQHNRKASRQPMQNLRSLGGTTQKDGFFDAARVNLGAAIAVSNLACTSSDELVAAGTIPYMVALLSAGNAARVQKIAAQALMHLATNNADNTRNIIAAGAFPALEALLSNSNTERSLQQVSKLLVQLLQSVPEMQQRAAKEAEVKKAAAAIRKVVKGGGGGGLGGPGGGAGGRGSLQAILEQGTAL